MDLLIEQEPALNQSLLLRSELLRIEMFHARARLAIACAVLTKDTVKLLKQAEKDTKSIEKEKTGENISGQMKKLDMALHVAVVRRRRGQLLGGLLGKELIKTADEFMTTEDIKNPAAIADVIAPGKWS